MPYGDDTSSSENVTYLNFNVLEKIAVLRMITCQASKREQYFVILLH